MKIKPMGAKVLLDKIEFEETSKGGIILLGPERMAPEQGTILAIGSAVTEVQKGERVCFNKFAGTEIEMVDQSLIMVEEDDILGVIE